MIPKFKNDINADFTIVKQPNKTYKIDFETKTIRGYTDGLDAIKQAVYLILNTERFINSIYSWNYGVELYDLIGCPAPLIFINIKQNVADALLQDDRINSVEDFTFDRKKDAVSATFTVKTDIGNFEAEKVVLVNV